jgi:hypothetical protein
MHEFSVKFNGQSKKMDLGHEALLTSEKNVYLKSLNK